jgi:primosomal protein N' (replication factor Y)
MFGFVVNHDVRGFADLQMEDRRIHAYPPFSRLIQITVRHIDKSVSHKLSTALGEMIRQKLRMVKVMGPAEPVISRIRNEYRMSLIVKIARDQGQLADIKAMLIHISEHLNEQKEFRSGRIVLDVDPM